ncbi:transforming growth factor beta activator LRRC33 [Electrophorus electricus]|uniref:Negative regulator of reactive oxygen species n=1 Tax=Electrophorus electricus TaxID=8005 RepID=A0A4W4G7M0_ELEEL|nr:transforming growth factor beta activator LRRC33 [Electrophorus electricus]
MPDLGAPRTLPFFALLPVLLALSQGLSHPPNSPCRVTQNTARCDGFRLTSVPSDLPHQIEELFLNQNLVLKLQYDSLSRYPSLRLFSCANSHLRAVEEDGFSGSPLIESLSLANNELHHGYVQLAHSMRCLTRLRTLDLSGNGLREDMASDLLQNLSSLEFLNLSNNNLLRLDEAIFRDLHQLKELNLERNLLFEIDGAFDHLKRLQRLNLAYNSLPCLVKFEMTQLVVLNASHNIIEWFITNLDLTETFQLETLDLSDNQLLYFPFLPQKSRLKTLLLSNNQISFYGHLAEHTSPNWTTSVEYYNLGGNLSNITVDLWNDSFHGDISSVELLDLRVNQVRYFPQGFLQKMPHLNRLWLTRNCLESLNLTAEDLPVTLYQLDVSNNRLTEVRAQLSSTSKLNNLTHLNLSLNDIQQLPPDMFTMLPSVSSVDLSYNRVGLCLPGDTTSLDSSACAVWRNLSSLKQLHIAGCNIMNVPPIIFKGTPLTHLELSNNPGLLIDQDSLLGLSGTLQHLGLSNTGLQNFDFSPYKNLKSLNISKNSMLELPRSLMTLNLKLLDLRDNMLSTIQSEQAFVLADRVQILYVNGNAFNCCQLQWYRTLEASRTLSVVDLSEVTCTDLHYQRQRAVLFNSFLCGRRNTEESFFWYILLFLSVSVSLVGIGVIYFLTFRPKVLPRAIKKRCWRPTPY